MALLHIMYILLSLQPQITSSTSHQTETPFLVCLPCSGSPSAFLFRPCRVKNQTDWSNITVVLVLKVTPICLVVTSKSHSVCAISQTAALFSFILAPPPMCLVSAVESVRETAFSTSTPTRLPRLASVTRQATGHLKRQLVS